ncbi:MAG TPA: hypothetical protein VNE86_03735, partial [Nitrososphaerales archaeon]|nr:hypothetical protein [Nitrososphaerales archaeon]
QIIDLRKRHPVLRRKKFLVDKKLFGASKDITWLQPNGHEMTEHAWNDAKIRTIGMILSGNAMDELNNEGNRIADETLLILLNADSSSVPFHLPRTGEEWKVLLHTNSKESNQGERRIKSGQIINVDGRSLVILHGIF